eukprot:87767-Prorocentrum_minimum.AAC.1
MKIASLVAPPTGPRLVSLNPSRCLSYRSAASRRMEKSSSGVLRVSKPRGSLVVWSGKDAE